jgi:hypothetical protein
MRLIVHPPASGVEGDDVRADALVLGCDSVLGRDGETLGKPTDAADARGRLVRYVSVAGDTLAQGSRRTSPTRLTAVVSRGRRP